MRPLLLILIWSIAATSLAAPKTRKKRVSSVSRGEDIRMWDGSVADVGWVNENTESAQTRTLARRPLTRDWFSLSVLGSHRLFQPDTPMVQASATAEPAIEGRFDDLIETKNSFEIRALIHPFRFLSLGAAYHTDDSSLRISGESVPIAPQEFLGHVQLGPRFGFVHLYAFYAQIFSSRSQASIRAPNRIGDDQSSQTYKVDVKQKGGEAGLGTEFRWGFLGFHAEAVRSLNRSYGLTLSDMDGAKTFDARGRPVFKAWQFGLSVNF